MTTSVLLPVQQFFNPATGAFLASGKVYAYQAGSSTPKALYTTSASTVELDNPLTLDAYGRRDGGIWGVGNYKIVVKDSTDSTTIWTIDDLGLSATTYSFSTGNLTISTNTITATTGSDIIFQTGTTGTYQFKGTSSQPATLRLYEDTDNGSNYITIAAPSSITSNTTITLPNSDISQHIAQVVYNVDGAVATGTTAIPLDDSIPQNTEGTQILSQAITPKTTTNLLKIEVVAVLAHTTVQPLTLALFQDSTADALAASVTQNITANKAITTTLTHWMAAGTTSATTFKVRAGGATGSTLSFNGQSGSRILAGYCASSITITEYTP